MEGRMGAPVVMEKARLGYGQRKRRWPRFGSWSRCTWHSGASRLKEKGRWCDVWVAAMVSRLGVCHGGTGKKGCPVRWCWRLGKVTAVGEDKGEVYSLIRNRILLRYRTR